MHKPQRPHRTLHVIDGRTGRTVTRTMEPLALEDEPEDEGLYPLQPVDSATGMVHRLAAACGDLARWAAEQPTALATALRSGWRRLRAALSLASRSELIRVRARVVRLEQRVARLSPRSSPRQRSSASRRE